MSNKNKVTQKLQNFINSISNVGDSNIPDDDGKSYYSKIDGSYLTRVGMENNLKYLLQFGITEQIQDASPDAKVSCIGFNPQEQKWYGWSHRAIFGFGINSKCEKGNCRFLPKDKEGFMESCLSFWVDEYSSGDDKATFEKGLDYLGEKMVDGVLVTYTYNDEVPNEALRGAKYEHFSKFPDKWGKGEWTAKTIEEAKEMAIDFAKGVS